MRSRRRTNYALEGVRRAVDTTIRTSYPPHVKVERLRAIHMVLNNFKYSIRSLPDWDELQRLEVRILDSINDYQSQLPSGVVTHY